MKVSGHNGSILKGTRVAATLGLWRYERDLGQFVFTVDAKLLDQNEFLMRSLPLNLELPMPGVHRGFFKITNVSISKSGKSITLDVEAPGAKTTEREKEEASIG